MSDTEKGPGIFKAIGAVFTRPFYDQLARQDAAKLESLSLRTAHDAMNEAVRTIQPDRDGFVPISLGSSPRNLGSAATEDLREQAQKAAYTQPLMKGYLRTLKRFVMGEGATVVVEIEGEDAESKALKKNVDAWLEGFRVVNNWDVLEDEIPERTWRDGESFLRRFKHAEKGPLEVTLTQEQKTRLEKLSVEVDQLRGEEIPKGMTLLRMLDPAQIRDPENVFDEGIVTSNDDAQNVLGYLWAPKASSTEAQFIPTDEMQHTKIEVDSDVLRGRSILEVLLKKNKQYEDWLAARILLSIARSTVYLLRKISGTKAQGQAIRDQEEKQGDSANDQRVRMPKSGSQVTIGKGVEWDFLTPNLQAQDAQHDGRHILLNMAAGVGHPEFMFTGDSSNANYASALVSAGPAFRDFESWQDFFGPVFIRVHRWALIDAASVGAIKGLTPEKAKTIRLRVQWSTIEVRDEEGHAKANEIKLRNNIISREFWRGDDGIDNRLEEERIAREQQEDFEFQATVGVGTGSENDGEE